MKNNGCIFKAAKILKLDNTHRLYALIHMYKIIKMRSSEIYKRKHWFELPGSTLFYKKTSVIAGSFPSYRFNKINFWISTVSTWTLYQKLLRMSVLWIFLWNVWLRWQKFVNINDTFKRVIGILVKRHVSTGILTRIACYSRQNTYWNVSHY